MNSFDAYRRAKEYHGGRPGGETNTKGWLIVGALVVLTAAAWFFAYKGYTLDKARPESRNSGGYSANRADIPMEPGMLLTERKSDELAVVFLDIGQGDAIFIQTPTDENILIDAGEGSNPDFEMARKVYAGERMILPFLKRNKVKKLDYFIGTHPHSDHIGGARTVFSEIPVEETWIAGKDHPSASKKDLLTAVKNQGNKLRAPEEVGGDLKIGEPLRLGGGARAWLIYTNPDAEEVNNSSLVILLYYGNNSVLLPGDLEFPGEETILKNWGEQIDVDILKVAHHGSSNTSTGYNFARFVSPDHAVFTVGGYNTYGHPAPEVVDRLRQFGAEVHRTDKDGTIFAFMDGDKIRFVHRRDLGVMVD